MSVKVRDLDYVNPRHPLRIGLVGFALVVLFSVCMGLVACVCSVVIAQAWFRLGYHHMDVVLSCSEYVVLVVFILVYVFAATWLLMQASTK